MRDLDGQKTPPYLCFKAVQVPVQVLHEAVEPAVCLTVAATLHLHSALRARRLTANIHHICPATASCFELETDPGLVTKPSQPLQGMRALTCGVASIRLAITAAPASAFTAGMPARCKIYNTFMSATASYSELERDPGLVTKPSQPLQGMKASMCGHASIRLAITVAQHLHSTSRACWLTAHGTCSLSADPSCSDSHKAL